MAKTNKDQTYLGFEQGPIRPPSEAQSLLIRVSRNCPWNRCTFCPVYKGTKFSLRPVDHVIEDIETVYRHVDQIRNLVEQKGGLAREDINEIARQVSPFEKAAFVAAVNWFANGMESIFLQDANSLVIKPRDLIHVLAHLRRRFPGVARITSYARSHTVARIADEDLDEMARTGLNRIHIGMESGSDKVLKKVCKGATKSTHIKAGIKVKKAGMELSEYIMPGLGGTELSQDHALESADCLNSIDPDFIRMRTLALPPSAPLSEEYLAGQFVPLKDVEVAQEILLFLQNIDGVGSMLKSDHILNLFDEVQGRFPQDKPRMAEVLQRFLDLDPMEQTLYQVGRRVGMFGRLTDLNDPTNRAQAQKIVDQLGITPENVDKTIYELMQRFI